MKKSQPKPVLLIRDTYLSVIKNSVGARMFRHSYALVGGKKRDLLRNGDLSCAIFVSAILKIFGLIKAAHHTVSSVIEDMEKSGWKRIKTPKEGSVIVWERQKFSKEEHSHIGFYLGKQTAVSNSALKGAPVKHNLTFGGKRKIEGIWWNKKLDG